MILLQTVILTTMTLTLTSKRNLDSFQRIRTRLRNNNSITASATGYEVIDDRIKNLSKEHLYLWCTLPFWSTTHREDHKCCFVDLVGRPIKNGEECPLYDFETS